jgi:hypothetical protein
MKTIKRNEKGFALVFALVTMTLIFIAVSGLTQSRQIWGFTATKQLDRTTMALTTRVDSVNWLTFFRYNAQKTPTSFSPSTSTFSPPSSFIGTTGASLFTPVSPYPQVTGGANYSLPANFGLVGPSTVGDPSVPIAPFDPYWGCNAALTGFGLTYAREMSSAAYALRAGATGAASNLKSWMSIDGALVQSVGLRYLPISIFTLYSPQPATTNALALSTSASANPFSLKINPLNYSWTSMFSSLYYTPNIGVGRLYIEGPVTINGTFPIGLPTVFTDGFSSSSAGTLALTFPTFLGSGSTNIAVPTTTEDFLSKRYSYFRGLISCGYDTSQRLLRYSSTANVNNKWVVPLAPQNYTNSPFQINTGTAGLVWDLTGGKYGYSYPNGGIRPDMVIAIDVTHLTTNTPPITAVFSNGVIISGPISGSDRTRNILYGYADSTTSGSLLDTNTITPTNNPFWKIDVASKTVTFTPNTTDTNGIKLLAGSGWYEQILGRPDVHMPLPTLMDSNYYATMAINIGRTDPTYGFIPDPNWKLVLPNYKPSEMSWARGYLLELLSPNAVVLPNGMESSLSPSVTPITALSSLVSPRIYVTSSSPINGLVITDAWDTSCPFLVPSGSTFTGSVNITGSLIIWSRPIAAPSESSVKVSLTPNWRFLDGSFCPPIIPCVLDIRSAPKDFKAYQMTAH